MKKLLLLRFSIVFILLFASFSPVLGTQYLFEEGEEKKVTIGGTEYTVKLEGVSSSTSVVISVNGVAKACVKNETYRISGIDIKVVDIYYYPREQQLSSAALDILESTTVNKTCSDSDKGIDYFIKGCVSVCTYTDQSAGCGLACDSCVDNVLIEGYCEGTESNTIKYTCPYGCVDGVCVKLINKTCSDSDGGLDYYTKGTVSVCTFTDTGGSCGGASDFCSGDILTEGYCKGSELNTIKYTCPYGCSYGACIKEGVFLTVYGRLLDRNTGKPLPKTTIYTDSVDGRSINPIYTDSDGYFEYSYKTEPNLMHILPSCNEQIVITFQKQSSGEYTAFYEERTCKSVRKTFASTNRVLKIGDIYLMQTSPFQLYSDTPVSFDLESKQSLECDVLFGGGNSYFNNNHYISLAIVPGYLARLKIGTREGQEIYSQWITVPQGFGCNVITASYIKGQFTFDVCGNKICAQGENYTCPSDCYTTECKDSDGGKNYYTKGTVTKGTAISSDCCAASKYSPDCVLSSDYLAERYCDSQDNLNTEIVYCSDGCKDGVCIQETTTIPGRCVNHDECSQACDNMGSEKWQYSRRWYGTCPYGVYGCMTGDCCLGQCTDKGECICERTNKVDIYGDVCPSGTTCGNDCYCHPIKDGTKIDITSPRDGQTVSGSVRVVAEASSTYELGDMTLSIQREGENIARAFPLTICAYGASLCPVGEPCVRHYTKTCSYDWDTFGYDGVVLLTAVITDNNYNKATDSIKVNVINYQTCNEKCESMGYRYGSCKSNCDSGEVNIGSNGCIIACQTCLEGQVCPPCPIHTCCCAGKKPCPYECCVNDPDYLDKSCPVAACPVCEPGGECPPCIQPKCIDHRCSWHPQEEYVLNFKEGWNMFSFPVDIRAYLTATSQTTAAQMTVERAITGKVIETTEIPPERQCSSPDHVWHYSNGKYIDVLNDPNGFVNGWGYWVRMDSDCMVKMTGNKITINDFPELEPGWNQIGAPSQAINFFHVIGDCNLVSGPWWFNSASKKYEKAQVLRPGEGYFVKVKDRCKLGSEIPPLPPEELGLGKAFRIK